MKYRRHTNLTASWMAILALATIAGCHATHSHKSKHCPSPPPVYMEYPYFGYHPTCWARWPADWIGCPPDVCLPVIDGPFVEPVPTPDHDAPPSPPMTPAADEDAVPMLPPDDNIPAPPAADEATSPALRPSAHRMPRSLRMQLRSPSRAATNRGVPAPPRVSLNSYSSSSYGDRQVLGHDYGLARLARQAAVRRSQDAQPSPPSLNELVGAESDDATEHHPPVKVGVVLTSHVGGS